MDRQQKEQKADTEPTKNKQKTNTECSLHARQKQITPAKMWRNPDTNTISTLFTVESGEAVISSLDLIWQKNGNRTSLSLSDPPVGSGVSCHTGRWRYYMTSIKANQVIKKKKKKDDIRKAFGRDWWFLAPWKVEELSKKSEFYFCLFNYFLRLVIGIKNDGVVRQKSAHKNFIKKVVVWGFLSLMGEKRKVW